MFVLLLFCIQPLKARIYQLKYGNSQYNTRAYSLVYRLQNRYDNVTLSPLLLQRGLRFCPIQRNGAARYDNVTLGPHLLQRGLRFGPIQRNGAARYDSVTLGPLLLQLSKSGLRVTLSYPRVL